MGTDASRSPKISCGSDKSFSITTLQLITEIDIELDFIYGMSDGSTCKHTSSCSSSGSAVANSQCGGATSVTFQVPSSAKNSSCQVGIQSVGFDCGPPAATVPPHSQSTSISSTSQSQSASTSQVSAQTASTSQQTSQGTSQSQSQSSAQIITTSQGIYQNKSQPASQPTTSLVSSPIIFTTSTVFATITSTITTCAPTITNCPAHPESQTEVVVVTSTKAVSVTVCPVTASQTPSSAAPASSSSA